ncbi:hypothetical protein PVAP13_9NG263200 [Panicum virgatum]|uniref:BTB domain-containing protein n=2 Tax=Panicum virgatum TaxID=38727 RepID=A0A8T0MIW3_PANVG|nr:hypothetical protein PVAP13_9NG263200 [Panicum virgatum]
MPTCDSASAIIGSSVTGSHLLHIEGYSRAKELLLRPDETAPADSQSFTVGGRTWLLRYVPSPCPLDVRYPGHIGVGLILVDTIPSPVCARARFVLLDQAGNEEPACTQSVGWRDFSLPAAPAVAVVIEKAAMEASPNLVVNDCFRLRCDVTVLKQFRREKRGSAWASTDTTLSMAPPSNLHHYLGALLVAKDGADVTFQVAGETFSAHRCILAARSPVFKAQLFGAMRESIGTGVCVRIDDIEPQAFGALLHFIYTDALPDMTGQEEALMAQHLLEAADRYALQRLKMICEEKLCGCLDMNTVANTLVLAEQHCCDRLKVACIQFLKSTQSLEAVMATSGFEHLIRSFPALLRELISELAAR